MDTSTAANGYEMTECDVAELIPKLHYHGDWLPQTELGVGRKTTKPGIIFNKGGEVPFNTPASAFVLEYKGLSLSMFESVEIRIDGYTNGLRFEFPNDLNNTVYRQGWNQAKQTDWTVLATVHNKIGASVLVRPCLFSQFGEIKPGDMRFTYRLCHPLQDYGNRLTIDHYVGSEGGPQELHAVSISLGELMIWNLVKEAHPTKWDSPNGEKNGGSSDGGNAKQNKTDNGDEDEGVGPGKVGNSRQYEVFGKGDKEDDGERGGASGKGKKAQKTKKKGKGYGSRVW